jgi:hypothetical protein
LALAGARNAEQAIQNVKVIELKLSAGEIEQNNNHQHKLELATVS